MHFNLQHNMKNLSNVAEITVQFKPNFKVSECPQISDSSTAHTILKEFWDEGLMQFLEEFKVIYLNNENHVLGISDIAMGGRASVSVDMKTIFSIALKCCASKIILSHNHPSCKLIPSSHDHAITKKAIEAGKVLDIQVADHLIIGINGYYSFRDEGDF
ncbi:JAB domain-containing protein [Sphingobacterium sp. MYb388]